MLRFFTRLEKTRNIVLFLFAILMVGSLVFFYTPASNTTLANLSQSGETAASVSGEDISVGQVVRQKENFSRFSRGQSFPAKTLLEGLIANRITRIEAERLGLTASDAEVATRIREQNKSTDGKPFDQAIYEQNVTEQFGNIADYEQSVRDDISAQKLQAFITSGVTVSEEEVLSDFQRKNTKFNVSYVAVNPAELAKNITPTDAELREYFDKNKATYYVNSPQKKIKYVFVNTEKIGQKLQIAEADLRAEYDRLPADKKTGGALGHEIVLRIANPEAEGTVQAKGAELVTQLRKDGPIVSEETFTTLAKGQSENPATALNGGKLSGPVKENPNKTDDPYQQLLKMKPGEITEPIEYQGRYFILRRGDDVPKPFEAARKELEVSLRNRRAYAVAAELAQKVVDSLKQSKDPIATAKQFATEANMNAADMVKETAFVKPGDDVPNIGVSPQFEEGIASLEAANDVGEKTPIPGGFAIPMLIGREEPRDAAFEEVKSQVVEVVKAEKARSQVEDIAKQIAAAAAANAGALAGAASSKGLTAKDQKDFILGSPLGEGPTAGTSEALEDAVYALKSGEVTKTPLKVGDNWYVVGVTERQDADMANFAKERSSLMDTMLSRKRGAVFSDYLAATKATFEKDGEIKIYQAALDKIDAPVPGLLPENS